MFSDMEFLKKADPQIYNLIRKEERRQKETLMMIPSENYASSAVREALATVLTNKYSEGYAGARYYQGNQYVDAIELLCIKRAKKLFKVPYVNVQPYSGSPANSAIYFGLLQLGDTIMGLSLASGGHLTHGVPNITFSGKFFRSVQYEVDTDGIIDYDDLEKQAQKVKPKLIIAGTTHYPRQLDFQRFARIADRLGAILMADISHVVGLVIAGVYPNPVPYAHVISTTTHKTLRGPREAMILVTEKGLKYDPSMGDKINRAVFPGLQGGPHNNTIAALAVALKEADTSKFRKYNRQIVKNAAVLSESLIKLDYNLISGGTDTHVMVIDLQNKQLLGNTAAEALETVGIVVNRNTVPFDPNPPFYPSGIRLGTPALTSRMMKGKEMRQIALLIHRTLNAVINSKKQLAVSIDQERKKLVRQEIIKATKTLSLIKKDVARLCRDFPVIKQY